VVLNGLFILLKAVCLVLKALSSHPNRTPGLCFVLCGVKAKNDLSSCFLRQYSPLGVLFSLASVICAHITKILGLHLGAIKFSVSALLSGLVCLYSCDSVPVIPAAASAVSAVCNYCSRFHWALFYHIFSLPKAEDVCSCRASVAICCGATCSMQSWLISYKLRRVATLILAQPLIGLVLLVSARRSTTIDLNISNVTISKL
jgi:hypothetical protein